ncbi:MAG: TIGR04211 family SH3 domain-containing protein [Gammaproteobacteria bacterium]|nr:TIGR04211 family SH3 domain-containing protein [Gammaproteobacteria bacterium]
MKLIKFLSLGLIMVTTMVSAESFVYITDQVEIPIRSESTTQGNNLIRTLPSGTKLSILQATEDGWTQVQYEDTTGWIISRYLSNSPPARQELEKISIENSTNKLMVSKLQGEKEQLENELLSLKDDNSKLAIQSSKAKAEKEHIEQIYQDALKLEHENEKLMQESLQLKTELQLANNNSQIEQDTSSRNWFIVGALVLFFGMMIGFILPNLMKRKRY